MDDFTPIDAGAAEMARWNALAAAKSRREKNPNSGSAEAFENQAAQLLVLRNKILDRLPEQYHEHRALVYPNYRADESRMRVT
jgi:hypothetical protein